MGVLGKAGLVSLGSAVGGLARWGACTAAEVYLGKAFPWGTLLINLTGCLFLGWFATVLSERLLDGLGRLRADELRLLVAVGFCGGYTTFSTFGWEANTLLSTNGFVGLLYVFASVFLGLLAVRLGVVLARRRGGG
jgi:CrcB protein